VLDSVPRYGVRPSAVVNEKLRRHLDGVGWRRDAGAGVAEAINVAARFNGRIEAHGRISEEIRAAEGMQVEHEQHLRRLAALVGKRETGANLHEAPLFAGSINAREVAQLLYDVIVQASTCPSVVTLTWTVIPRSSEAFP
jgi:hypothetical protein